MDSYHNNHNNHLKGKFNLCSAVPLVWSFRSTADTELRNRNPAAPEPPPDRRDGPVGIEDLTSGAPRKTQQGAAAEDGTEGAEREKGTCPAPGAWSPLTAHVCLGTALALSAYVCYRVYFH